MKQLTSNQTILENLEKKESQNQLLFKSKLFQKLNLTKIFFFNQKLELEKLLPI